MAEAAVAEKKPKRPPRPKPTLTPLAYSVNSAAGVMGLGRSTIYNLINAGHLRAHRLAGKTVIYQEDLLAFRATGEALPAKAAQSSIR